MNHRYDDIINMPHHTSTSRKHMSVYDRAAQFSPFAALTGYEGAVKETARLTEKMEVPEQDRVDYINSQLNRILECIHQRPLAVLTYFVPDKLKAGGKYVTTQGKVRIIDEYENSVVFENGTRIPIESLWSVELAQDTDKLSDFCFTINPSKQPQAENHKYREDYSKGKS